MKNSKTKKIVFTALFTALITISTMFIRIPLPLGYVNLGDAFIFLAVFLLGPIYGTFAGALGSGLADLLGFPLYAPGTLVIKALMALVCFFIFKLINKSDKLSIVAEIISGIIGTIIMAFGYFFYEILFFETVGVAIVNVPWNLLQGAVGTAIAVLIMRLIKSTKLFDEFHN